MVGSHEPPKCHGKERWQLRAPGVHAGAEEAGDIWKCSFSAFTVQRTFFTSFNLFCSNSQVKNSFHEPEPAATALRLAMALGTSWKPCPCIPPPAAAARMLKNGHEAQGTQLAPSPSLLHLRCPTPTPFSPHCCHLVVFGVMNLLCVLRAGTAHNPF